MRTGGSGPAPTRALKKSDTARHAAMDTKRFMTGSRSEHGPVEQLNRVDDLDLPSVDGGLGLDVHGAADVSGDAGLHAGGIDVREFPISQVGGHRGVREDVGAGGAAAHLALGQGDDLEA